MQYASVFHRPMSEYAFPVDSRHLVFRLRTARGDLKSVTFFYADRADMSPELPFTPAGMPLVRSDMLYDWYEYTLETDRQRIAYYFLLDDGETRCRYAGDQFEKMSAHIERAEYFQYPFNHKADLFRVPEWAGDSVVYNIFPDSFADGKRRISCRGRQTDWKGFPSAGKHGGTINGIRENLDYIASLGCNCVYLNPVFAAGAYHKYDLLDYEHIDPCFGTDAEFAALVDEAHGKGIRVIIDGVFNHVSRYHFSFRDVLEKGRKSPYYSWFYELPDPLTLPAEGEQPKYVCFSYVADMPKTDTSDASLRKYFCDIGAYWINRYHVDGWRLDVANELDDGFLRAFRAAVKAADPDALIIGEVWENAEHYMRGDMLDSAMNYDFRRFCTQFFAEGILNAEEFDLRVSTLLTRYQSQAIRTQLNLLDGHDVSRFITLCGGDRERMEAAVAFQMTFPGMPCVFYGDEKGMEGRSEDEYRQPMDWNAVSAFEEIYRKLIALRGAHSALRSGSFRTDVTAGHVYAYTRADERERIHVIFNMGGEPVPYTPEGKILLQKGFERGILMSKGYCISGE